MISGRWSEAIRASGENGARTPVTRTCGLTKQWSMRIAGKAEGKVYTHGFRPSSRWASARCRVRVW